jgi:2-keto-4-pentenoate hydratase/2-oxohepta-3-ene-1,7-dioic acid hydratase in catechol pathway
MKIMALNRTLGETISDPIAVDIIPDSAIIKDRKPFFMPDFSSKWVYDLNIAIRVNRLGKNVGEKFANRYYDAITLCLRMIPVDMVEKISSAGITSNIATSFDGALILGDWQPIDSIQDHIKIKIGDFETTINTADIKIDNSIKQLSKYFTFKIGDILIPAKLNHQSEFRIDDIIMGQINDIECINFKIK